MALFGNKQSGAPELTPEDLVNQKKELIEAEVEQYVGSSGVPTKWLEYGLWYQQHRRFFTLSVVWSLSIVAAVSWAFALYYVADFFIIGIRQDQENAVALSQSSLHAGRPDQTVNLEYSFEQAIALPDGRYDLVGKVVNNSTNGWASFGYYFSDGLQNLGAGNGFVYPGETKYLVALAQTLSGSPFDVRLVLDNPLLNRFTPRTMPDWASFRDDHLDFIYQDKVYVPADQSGLTEKIPINSVSFTIINNSAYTYKVAPFLIILYDGDKIVAVDRYIVNDFRSRAKVKASLSFIGSLGPVDHLEIYPDVNILNADNFGSIQ